MYEKSSAEFKKKWFAVSNIWTWNGYIITFVRYETAWLVSMIDDKKTNWQGVLNKATYVLIVQST